MIQVKNSKHIFVGDTMPKFFKKFTERNLDAVIILHLIVLYHKMVGILSKNDTITNTYEKQ